MREHEVPTHVQAEDRVLLWFSFPQIVAMIAVCALSYGAYQYAPVGPSGARMALSVVLGLVGIIAVVGKIGGRRLPLVAADLLSFWLGPRLYAGTLSHLLRSEPPPPPPASPGPLTLMAGRARRRIRRLRRGRERRNGRRRLPLPGRTGKEDGRRKKRRDDAGRGNGSRETRRRKRWFAVLAVAALASLILAGDRAAVADEGLIEEGWNIEEIEYEIPEPVPGRRLYMERLEVSGDRARVSLRAATGVETVTLAFGGEQSRPLRMWWPATLGQGESNDYDLPLSGESPSLDFSWEDSVGQAGAFGLEGEQLPYPLPRSEGELCNVSVVSVEWVPGTIRGAVSSECASMVEERIDVDVAAGHHGQAVTAVIEGAVTSIRGTLRVDAGGASTVSFDRPRRGDPFLGVDREGRDGPRRGPGGHLRGDCGGGDSAADATDAPSREDRNAIRKGVGRAAGNGQVGLRDGARGPRRRDDHGARGHGLPFDTPEDRARALYL